LLARGLTRAAVGTVQAMIGAPLSSFHEEPNMGAAVKSEEAVLMVFDRREVCRAVTSDCARFDLPQSIVLK
jgi:hypothetical protein